MKFWFACLLGCVCVGFSGCVRAYYKTEVAPNLTLNKTQTLMFGLEKNATIADKKLKILLGDALIANGYQAAEFNSNRKNPPCLVTFSQQVFSTQYTQSHTTFRSKTINTYTPPIYSQGVYIPATVVSSVINIPTQVVETKILTTKGVGISISCKEDGEFVQVSSGAVIAEIDDYKEHTKSILDNLVKRLGQDFTGKVVVHNFFKENAQPTDKISSRKCQNLAKCGSM